VKLWVTDERPWEMKLTTRKNPVGYAKVTWVTSLGLPALRVPYRCFLRLMRSAPRSS